MAVRARGLSRGGGLSWGFKSTWEPSSFLHLTTPQPALSLRPGRSPPTQLCSGTLCWPWGARPGGVCLAAGLAVLTSPLPPPAPNSAAGPGPPPGDGPAGCRRERRQEGGRSQERRQPSASSEKQRFYSCDRFGGREPPQPQPSLSSHPASPTAGQEPGPPRQGSASANGSPLLPTSGASTPGRGGRRQLPQTPLTPRPSIAYKTANSSPVHFAGAQTSLPAFSPGRLSRGLSEHNALLQRDPLSQPLAASSRIGSDPYLGRRLDSEAAARTQPEDTLTFEEAVATNSGRSSRTSYVSSLTSQSHPLRRVPNGYHCTLGLSSGGGGRGRRSYHHPDQDHWC
ncbi:voltage-dependent N-type calcium channel subunit alpha-1B-like [Orcinus orca]|uniref:voltage-dependent N-type calcium channel subunit alpha-1B-like n=1 Tax=Orcinus orca TaxID=9733 RepID=UPI0021129A95|nr:voltage-dependent N-type calcium channel subunit alpha-1B-like [Orcinus orca]